MEAYPSMSMASSTEWQDQVLKHGPWLHRLISRQLDEPDAVEDVLQETLTAAIRSEAEGRQEGVQDLRAWLGGVARNKSRHYIRGEERKRRNHNRFAEECTPFQGPPTAVTPLELLLHSERMGAVQSGLDSLAEEDTNLLRMKYLEQLNYEQIGTALGIDRNAVTNRLRRARTRLRQALVGTSLNDRPTEP